MGWGPNEHSLRIQSPGHLRPQPGEGHPCLSPPTSSSKGWAVRTPGPPLSGEACFSGASAFCTPCSRSGQKAPRTSGDLEQGPHAHFCDSGLFSLATCWLLPLGPQHCLGAWWPLPLSPESAGGLGRTHVTLACPLHHASSKTEEPQPGFLIDTVPLDQSWDGDGASETKAGSVFTQDPLDLQKSAPQACPDLPRTAALGPAARLPRPFGQKTPWRRAGRGQDDLEVVRAQPATAQARTPARPRRGFTDQRNRPARQGL